MKLKLIIEAVYEIPDDQVVQAYGTTDPAECARIDERGDPRMLLDLANGKLTHRVEVA